MNHHPNTEPSPLRYYARLHQVIKNGQGTDAIWYKLAKTCVSLGKNREAIGCLGKVRSVAMQRSLRRDLARRGLIRQDGSSAAHRALAARTPFSLAAGLHDAVNFVLDGRMRTAMLAAILGFTLALQIGASITSISDAPWLRVVAMVPVLCVVALAGVLWRHSVLFGILGIKDNDLLPHGPEMVRQAGQILSDTFAIGALLLAPAVYLAVHGHPGAAPLWFAAALAFLPMTAALRLCGRSWRSLTTRRLMHTMRTAGSEYASVTGIGLVLLMPAFVVFTLMLGKPMYQVVSVTGLFAIVPGLLLASMLGTVLRRARPRLPDELAWGALPHAPRATF